MWIDVTRPIAAGQLAYPGDPSATVEQVVENGVLVSRLTLTTHSGTHLDAPAHVVAGGQTIDEIGWDSFFVRAQVLRVRSPRVASVKEVASRLEPGAGAVLFRTRNETLHRGAFDPGHVYVEERLAMLLAQRGVRIVGIDYLSIDPPASLVAHRVLLEAGVLVLEDLDLRGVREGMYRMACVPLKIAQGDGAPCRVLLQPAEAA